MDRIIFSLVPSFFGALFALMALKGIKTGKLPARGGFIVQSETPRLFCVELIFDCAMAAICFGTGMAFLAGLIPLGPKP